MHQSYHQQADPTGGIQLGKGYAAGNAHIGNQHQNGGNELKEGAMDALHISDKFVQQDYRCIEAGCAKAEGNSQQVIAPGCHIPHPGDQNNSQSGHGKADPLFDGHFLLEQDRAGHRHDHRRKIITQGCH